MRYLVNLKDVTQANLDLVGGKNASIGEMLRNLSHQGINVPGGFAITTNAYRAFLSQNNLDKKIAYLIHSLKMNDIHALNKRSAEIRRSIMATPFLQDFENEIVAAIKTFNNKTSFAIRSSATAEDLPEASFAGQQETFLNVTGFKNILHSIKLVYASLFTSRAIDYRYRQQLDNMKYAISVGIQSMIRSDKAASGVMFTLDTESGFDKVILINASYGLGEGLVQGKVNPDEFYVYKPSLEQQKFSILQRKLGEKKLKMIYGKTKDSHIAIKTVNTSSSEQRQFSISDDDIVKLAEFALKIEKHYGKPMDIEWGKDGISGKLYIVQARPETVKSRSQHQVIEQY